MGENAGKKRVAAALTIGTHSGLGAVAAVLETRTPGAGAALAAALPAAERLTAWAWERLSGIVEESGMTARQVVQELSDDPSGLRLLSAALETVRVAPYEEKLRILGQALVIGASDHTRIDDEMLVVAAVANLEPYHLRLLQVAADVAASNDKGTFNTLIVNESDSALTVEMADILVGVLVGHGLAAKPTTLGGKTYQVTELGRLVLHRVREVDV